MKLIQCASCGAQNRIEGFSYSRFPICGKCRASLPEPASIRSLRVAVKYKYWIILGVIIGGTVMMDQLRSPSRTSPASAKSEYRASSPFPAQAVLAYPVVQVNQGIRERFTNAKTIAPFRIVTPAGPESYYVKLIDAFTGTPAMSFFIFGGQSFEAEVPLGTYRVKYATGETWYGENHLFGPTTRYSEADKTFEFSVQGNQISGYTVELIRQRGGNLHTKSISANQF